MNRVLISDLAGTDLASIWAYVAQDRPEAADRLLRTLLERCHFLARFAEIGERCEHLAPGLRRFSVGSYVIYYRPVENGVQIVRVISGARDVEGLF